MLWTSLCFNTCWPVGKNAKVCLTQWTRCGRVLHVSWELTGSLAVSFRQLHNGEITSKLFYPDTTWITITVYQARSQAVTVSTCILEVSGLELGRDTNYPDFYDFPQSLQKMPRCVFKLSERKDWSWGNVLTCIWGYSVRIWAKTLAILTKVFRGFPHSPKANVGNVYQLYYPPLPSKYFLIHHPSSYHSKPHGPLILKAMQNSPLISAWSLPLTSIPIHYSRVILPFGAIHFSYRQRRKVHHAGIFRVPVPIVTKSFYCWNACSDFTASSYASSTISVSYGFIIH